MTTVDRLNIEITANGPMLERSMRDAERRVDVGATRMAQSVRKAETAMSGGFMSNIGKRGRSVGAIGGIAAGALGGAVGGLPGFFLGMAVFTVVGKGLDALSNSLYKAQTAAEQFAQRVGTASLIGNVTRGGIGASLRGFLTNPHETDHARRKREIDEAFDSERDAVLKSFGSQVDPLISARNAAKASMDSLWNRLAGAFGIGPGFQGAQKDFKNAQNQIDALAAVKDSALQQLEQLRGRALASPMSGKAQASFDTLNTVFGQMRVANRFKGLQELPATEEKQEDTLKAVNDILSLLNRVLGTGFMPFA